MTKLVKDAGRGIRLLMVNTTRPVFNGQMMFILKYLRAMDRSDMSVGFVCVTEPIPEIRAELEALGATVYALPLRHRHPLAYLRGLSRLLRRESWDIVHVHGNSSTMALELTAARLTGVPARIAHSHNTSTRFPIVHRLLKPLLLRQANVRMACGQDAGRWLFGKLPFEIVPIAADPELYRFDAEARVATRSALGLHDGDLLVGLIGSLIAVKNHAFLLEAFSLARRQSPGLRLAFIGDGALRDELARTAESLGIADAVTFTGAVSDVPRYLRAMDLLALPSLYEGFPNVLVEAQLAGLPALVSDHVTRDCDMTGLLTYLPLDVQAWADALANARLTDRRAACEASCAEIIRRGYDISSAAAKLKARYEALASAPSN